MKKILSIIIILLLFSCERKNDLAIKYLNAFYTVKQEFLTNSQGEKRKVRKHNEKLLKLRWQEIMGNKDEVIAFLISLENDTINTSIYGQNYNESFFSIQKLPNNIHALYLIECIIRDDYLFNRRFPTKFDKAEYFRHDGLNYIYDTISINRLEGSDILHPINLAKYKSEFNQAWKMYKKWYSDVYLKSDSSDKSPLSNSHLKWNSRHFAANGSFHIYDSNFMKKEENPWVQKLLHLDFKIGSNNIRDSIN